LRNGSSIHFFSDDEDEADEVSSVALDGPQTNRLDSRNVAPVGMSGDLELVEAQVNSENALISCKPGSIIALKTYNYRRSCWLLHQSIVKHL